MIPNNPKVANGFVKHYHNFYYTTRELSVGVKFFLAYLLSKDNFFGDNGEFYLTDEEIQEDLRVGRSSISRWRKRLKTTPFVDYTPGKYKGSATTYNVKGIKMILSNEDNKERVSKRDIKGIKMNHKAYQNESERVSNWHNNKEVNKEVKEEVKKESSEGSTSACPNSQASPSSEQSPTLKNDLDYLKNLINGKDRDDAGQVIMEELDISRPAAYNKLIEITMAGKKR